MSIKYVGPVGNTFVDYEGHSTVSVCNGELQIEGVTFEGFRRVDADIVRRAVAIRPNGGTVRPADLGGE